jgi:hypothetical protein
MGSTGDPCHGLVRGVDVRLEAGHDNARSVSMTNESMIVSQ